MQNHLKQDFNIKKPEKDSENYNEINGIVTRYFTLMSALGQNMYNHTKTGDNYEPDKGHEYLIHYTREYFEARPINFLTNGEHTVFKKTAAELGLHGQEAHYHDVLHGLLKDGVGMVMPKYAEILLSPKQIYPTLYFKHRTPEDIAYKLGGRMPDKEDKDNIFVIEEGSLQMVVYQLFNSDLSNDYFVTQGVQTGTISGVIDSAFPDFVKNVGSSGVTLAKLADGQQGNKITAVLGNGEESLDPKYVKEEYYDPSKGGKGRLLIMMPYPIAQLDTLGVVQMQGNSVASEIVLTTTT